MTALRPPTRAQKDEATGEFKPAFNDDAQACRELLRRAAPVRRRSRTPSRWCGLAQNVTAMRTSLRILALVLGHGSVAALSPVIA